LKRIAKGILPLLAALIALLASGRPGLAANGGLDQATNGLTALAAGEYRKAIALLTQAIDSNGLPEGQTHVYFAARGYAKAAEGDFMGAVEDDTAALNRHPGYRLALFNRGNAYFAMRRYDLAISDYSRLLNTDPNDANALNNRGAAWFCKGNLQSALANYSQAIALAPEDPDPLLNRGKVYEALGDVDKARGDFLHIKQLDPSAKTPLD